ncbi:MAG: hypothetical protein L0Y71_13940 [Gemmataceae bacterium]|nr:hypothetical protein [Gemmataceae bacterium]
MTDPHAHDHAHGHPAPLPFTEEEIQHLHAQDLYAATVVVSLMVGIFSVGVVLYLIVLWACWS